MNKEVVQAVLERSQGLCEICYSSYMVQQHHIVGGRGKRNQHETVESVIALCWDHHYGNKGCHGKDGRELVLRLRRELQQTYFNQGYTEDQVREMMGGELY